MPSVNPLPSIREMLEKDAGELGEPHSPAAEPPSTPVEGAKEVEKLEPSSEPEEEFSKFEQQLLAGRNLSGWTDAQKREWLEARKDLVRGWHGSQAAYASAKRGWDELNRLGVTIQDLQSFLAARQGGQTHPPSDQAAVSPAAAKTLRGIDRLIEESSDPEVKEQLRKTKTVLLEEASQVVEDHLSSRMKPFEEKLARLENLAQGYSFSEANAEIDALEDQDGWPVELIEKHREQLVGYKMQFPRLEREDILFRVVGRELKDFLKPGLKTSEKVESPKPKGKSPSVSQGLEEASVVDEKPFQDRHGRLSNVTGFVRAQLGKVLGG